MRVLQLGPFAPPHGGVQANLTAIREALLERGIACPVVTLTRSPNASTDDADVYRPQNAFQFIRFLIRLRYDIVHLHLGGNLTFRLLGVTLLCTLLPRRKSVLTFHSGGYASTGAGTTARPSTLRGFIFRRVDKIIGVNREIVQMFERFGVSTDKVRLIPPHALKTPASDTEIPQRLREFIETHEPVLLSVGLLEHEYSLPLQIEVLGLVRKSYPKAGLIMIGSGSQEQALQNLIEKQSYASDIMLCGDTEHDVTIKVIAKSDLMLRTTVYDGDAISVREAIHMGTPVVATNNGMRPNGVRLISAPNLNELDVAIKECLAAPKKSASVSKDENENIEAVLELYQELMHHH